MHRFYLLRSSKKEFLFLIEGYYQFCFDNTADRFASKKIEAFIAVVVPDDPFEAQALVAEELKSNETVETYNILKVRATHKILKRV